MEQKQYAAHIRDLFDISISQGFSTRSPLSSIENQLRRTESITKKTAGHINAISSVNNDNTLLEKKTNSSLTSITSHSSSLVKHNQAIVDDETHTTTCSSTSITSRLSSLIKHNQAILEDEAHATNCSSISNTSRSSSLVKRKQLDVDHEGFTSIEGDRFEGTLAKRSKKLFHHILPLTESQLILGWSIIHVRGIGLINKDASKQCLNICYINSIIQCLANTAPFVQWLLSDNNHGLCQLTVFAELCSVCALRSIIINIHPRIRNKFDSSYELTEASAFQISRRITELSSSFVPGQQEDPSEFLIILLHHLMECVSSNDKTSFSTYSYNPFRSIFGIIFKSSITCSTCENKTVKKTYETIWSISIISYSNLENALRAFCSKEKLTGDNAFECLRCNRKTTALQSLQITNISPVIIIHLKPVQNSQ